MNDEAEEDDAEEAADEQDEYDDNDKENRRQHPYDFHRRSARDETKRGRTRPRGRTRSPLKVGRYQPKKDEDEDEDEVEDTMRTRGGKPESRMRT